MTAHERLIFVFTCIIFAAGQFYWIGARLKQFQRFIPTFRFFGPRPLAWDVVLAYRGLVTGGGSSDWHAYGASRYHWFSPAWSPERRIGKALTDHYRRLFQILSAGGRPPRSAAQFLIPLILDDPAIQGFDRIQVAYYLVTSGMLKEAPQAQEMLRFTISAQGEILD
ncbi:hypothetical protein [Rhizobium ruizarguesonis]|uniref:hypothetical protein n=1 Tax=Rhizobium ruizarguesonis TaxID=2081791 RepID=UPI00102FC394|nr:hypothetical protein [Rhizobium ruizarguesonis]TBE99681.1 hypothetical protein ELG98_25410 [Rhizobium ruizarguesonis]